MKSAETTDNSSLQNIPLKSHFGKYKFKVTYNISEDTLKLQNKLEAINLDNNLRSVNSLDLNPLSHAPIKSTPSK